MTEQRDSMAEIMANYVVTGVATKGEDFLKLFPWMSLSPEAIEACIEHSKATLTVEGVGNEYSEYIKALEPAAIAYTEYLGKRKEEQASMNHCFKLLREEL